MAKKKQTRSSVRFVMGMVLYALAFALVTAVGLRFFWSYLSAYETSRPKNTMEEYIASFDEEHIKRVSADFVATLDHNIQTEEDSYAVIASAMEGKLSYAKLSAESSEDKTVYILMLDGEKLGRVELTKQDDPVFGFSPWSVSDEELDFTWLLSSKEITVPDSWTVSCSGNILDVSYLSGEKIPYEVLEGFYDEGFSLPYMVTYKIDSFVGDVEFETEDENGQSVELSGDGNVGLNDNCTESEKTEINALVQNFIQGYVHFMSKRDGFNNYSALMEYVVQGSELDSRLYQAIEGQFYASSNGDEIVSITLNNSINLGNGNYFADVTFIVDTTGQKGVVQTTNNSKFILSRTDSGLKVAAMD